MSLLESEIDVQHLLLYHRLLEQPLGRAVQAYLADPGIETAVPVARALWEAELSLRDYIIDVARYDENPFTRAAERGNVSEGMLTAARHDLYILGRLAHLRLEADLPLPPDREPSTALARSLAATWDWRAFAEELAADIRAGGAGDRGRYHAFRWENGAMQGIRHPDPIRLEDLVGNEEAKALVVRNTEQFLRGLPANNLLLYGDRGTGKSSTVKALLHRYGDQGLRLVEVRREDVSRLGDVMRALQDLPQRFILFLDDLSFEETETGYKSFKAVLEGSLERRPPNVVVYATSNRRHLVRERRSDRQVGGGDDLNPKETVEEIVSLADRFGMTIIFTSPDQEQYLQIVMSLAAKRGIDMPPEELRRQALQWSLWHNGRSGRTARQFIDDLCGRLGIPVC
ncbi:MAG TPA: ATP-binding protein [Symbiobacteriaceae bacterium]